MSLGDFVEEPSYLAYSISLEELGGVVSLLDLTALLCVVVSLLDLSAFLDGVLSFLAFTESF